MGARSSSFCSDPSVVRVMAFFLRQVKESAMTQKDFSFPVPIPVRTESSVSGLRGLNRVLKWWEMWLLTG